jgi:hypothetical protein
MSVLPHFPFGTNASAPFSVAAREAQRRLKDGRDRFPGTFARAMRSGRGVATHAWRSRRNVAVDGRGDPPPVTEYIRAYYGMPSQRRDVLAVTDSRFGRAIPSFVARLAVIGVVVMYFLVSDELGSDFANGEGNAAAAEPAAEVVPRTLPAGQLHMGHVSTGVPAVDSRLHGFLTGDVDESFSQLVVQQIPCGTLPWDGQPWLTCVGGETRGTVHEEILATCDPRWVTPEAAKAELTAALVQQPGVLSVARVGEGYTAVLAWPEVPDRTLVLSIAPLGIASYGAACGPAVAPPPGDELALMAAPAH